MQHTIPISFGRMPHEVAINPHASALPSVTQVIIFSLEVPLVTDVFAGVFLKWMVRRRTDGVPWNPRELVCRISCT